MRKLGLLTRTTNETKQRVIELYQRGHSQIYIEGALSMTRKTIRAILESENIKRSKGDQTIHHHLTSSLREDAFDVVSDEMSYWLGFLYADGFVTNPQTTTAIGVLLKESDIKHLEKLKEFLKAPQKIRHDVKYKNVGFKIGSQRLHARLLRWGFTTNKSYDAVPPVVMLYNRHFWRGVIDGDGYLGTIRGIPRLSLCGTKDMMEGFRNFLVLSGVNTDRLIAKHPEKSLHIFEIGANLAVLGSKILYEDCNVYLDRKFEVYKNWLETKYNDRII